MSPWGVRVTDSTVWKEGYVYVHVCTCIMCMRVSHVCMHLWAHACVRMYPMCICVNMFASMCMSPCVHVPVCMFACMCMCIHVHESAPTVCSEDQAPWPAAR